MSSDLSLSSFTLSKSQQEFYSAATKDQVLARFAIASATGIIGTAITRCVIEATELYYDTKDGLFDIEEWKKHYKKCLESIVDDNVNSSERILPFLLGAAAFGAGFYFGYNVI